MRSVFNISVISVTGRNENIFPTLPTSQNSAEVKFISLVLELWRCKSCAALTLSTLQWRHCSSSQRDWARLHPGRQLQRIHWQR